MPQNGACLSRNERQTCIFFSYSFKLTPRNSRISRGGGTLEGPATAPKLRDLDQPFVFELSSSRRGRYRFEFHDVDGPDNWRLLRPDLVLLCYAIGQRSSLDSMQNLVSSRAPAQRYTAFPSSPRPPSPPNPENIPP